MNFFCVDNLFLVVMVVGLTVKCYKTIEPVLVQLVNFPFHVHCPAATGQVTKQSPVVLTTRTICDQNLKVQNPPNTQLGHMLQYTSALLSIHEYPESFLFV